jgi:hypothetical protein
VTSAISPKLTGGKPDRQTGRPKPAALDQAADFLDGELTDGPLPKAEIERRAKEAGISASTLRRAKDHLGVKARKDGFGGGWSWELPTEPDAEDDQDRACHPENLSTFAEPAPESAGPAEDAQMGLFAEPPRVPERPAEGGQVSGGSKPPAGSDYTEGYL